jgi:hypothetical protein
MPITFVTPPLNSCNQPVPPHRRRLLAQAPPPTSASTSTRKAKVARGDCVNASTSVPTAETINMRGTSVRRSHRRSNLDWIRLSFYASFNALSLTAQFTISRFYFRFYPTTLSFSHVGDVLPKPTPRGIPPHQIHRVVTPSVHPGTQPNHLRGIPPNHLRGIPPNQPRGIPPQLLSLTRSPLPTHSRLQRAPLERKEHRYKGTYPILQRMLLI